MSVLRPALPSGLVWAQASSCLNWRFRQLVVVQGDDDVADAVLTAVKTARYIKRVAEPKDAAEIRRALSTPHPRWCEVDELLAERSILLGKILEEKRDPTKDEAAELRAMAEQRAELHGICLDEHFEAALRDWHGLYRGAAEDVEREEAARRASEIVALSTGASDDFTGTLGDEMNSRTMTGGPAHVWTCPGGNSKAKIGASNNTIGITATPYLFDGTASAVGDQRTSVKILQLTGANDGIIARWTDATHHYMTDCYVNGINGDTDLYYIDGGSYTQIGSTAASSWTTNAVGGCETLGTSIGSLIGGSYVVGPSTDTHRATGVGALYFGNNANSNFDNYLWEIASSSYDATRMMMAA